MRITDGQRSFADRRPTRSWACAEFLLASMPLPGRDPKPAEKISWRQSDVASAETSEGTGPDDSPEATRRDFLYIATGAFGVVALGAMTWPLIDQMNPDASALALASVDVDISQLNQGESITVMWRGKPVFVRRRTQKEIEEAKAVPLDELKDPLARNPNLPGEAPATDENRAAEAGEEWLVMIGICTHLGCIPLGQQGEYGGWFCPCHGSHYDTAGRIRRGPAPENLLIPPYAFDESVITIG
jgi:ubiquinol-cytochrome c reductase iron-sulfur subunit